MSEKESSAIPKRLGPHGYRPNAGRPKGSLNKENKALREMILGALDKCGGEEYLARQAEENPGPFMSLLGKVLPTTLDGQIGHVINWPVNAPGIES